MLELHASDLALLGYLGAVQLGLGTWVLMKGVRGLPAVEVSLLLLAEPVLSTFWAWTMLGEQPGPWSLAGCGVILCATVIRVLLQRGPAAIR